MAALPPVANTVKVVLSGTVAGVLWNHVLHFAYSGGPPTGANMAQASSVVYNEWIANLMPHAHTDCVLTDVLVQDLSSDLGAVGETGGSQVGGLVGLATPNNVAMLVNKHILRHYKGGHPRCYLPLGSMNEVASPTTWQASFVSAVQTGYVAFIGNCANGFMWTGAGAEVVVHYRKDNQPVAVPFTDVIQNYSASGTLATLRRRLGR